MDWYDTPNFKDYGEITCPKCNGSKIDEEESPCTHCDATGEVPMTMDDRYAEEWSYREDRQNEFDD